jgi:hypothetical protein
MWTVKGKVVPVHAMEAHEVGNEGRAFVVLNCGQLQALVTLLVVPV